MLQWLPKTNHVKKPITRTKIAWGQQFLDTSHLWKRTDLLTALEVDDPFVFEAPMRCWIKANKGLSEMMGKTRRLAMFQWDPEAVAEVVRVAQSPLTKVKKVAC